MENNRSKVVPVSEYFSSAMDYSESWYDDYLLCARENLCMDQVSGKMMPMLVVVSLYGGLVRDMFEVVRRSCWRMSVMVFRSDEELLEYVIGNGLEDRCSEIILLDEKKGVVLGK